MQNSKIVNIHCYSCQVKKQFYCMSGVCVLIAIVSAKRCQCRRSAVQCVRFLVTRPCQNSQANFSLLSICNRCSVRFLF